MRLNRIDFEAHFYASIRVSVLPGAQHRCNADISCEKTGLRDRFFFLSSLISGQEPRECNDGESLNLVLTE